MDSRIAELEAFFKSSYGLAANQIEVYSATRQNVTEEKLVGLTDDIRRVSWNPYSIVFLFVLSHGVLVQGPPSGEDLLIVASNTPPNPSSVDRGRLLGSSLLRAFAGMGHDSVAFAFFDTCNSGILDEFNSQFAFLFSEMQIRATALASSSAIGNSYGFSLLRHLSTGGKTRHRRALRALSWCGLSRFKTKQPRSVVTDDSLCLDGIGPKTGLLILLPDFSRRNSEDHRRRCQRSFQGGANSPVLSKAHSHCGTASTRAS